MPEGWPWALARRACLRHRVALVVAHPDDECIGLGGSLHLLPELLLVHVTDGAPRRLEDWRRAGFARVEDYAAARDGEVDAALRVAGVRPERVRLGVADQDAALAMPWVAGELGRLFRRFRAEVVVTHAYEGGHPDHDSVAACVQVAAGGGVPVVEFPLYRAGGVVQRFLSEGEGVEIRLDAGEMGRKRAMLACFRTQAGVVGMFDPAVERVRESPGHDFGRAPHQGRLNYEEWGWEMTGERWRGLARALEGACGG